MRDFIPSGIAKKQTPVIRLLEDTLRAKKIDMPLDDQTALVENITRIVYLSAKVQEGYTRSERAKALLSAHLAGDIDLSKPDVKPKEMESKSKQYLADKPKTTTKKIMKITPISGWDRVSFEHDDGPYR